MEIVRNIDECIKSCNARRRLADLKNVFRNWIRNVFPDGRSNFMVNNLIDPISAVYGGREVPPGISKISRVYHIKDLLSIMLICFFAELDKFEIVVRHRNDYPTLLRKGSECFAEQLI